MNYKKSLYIASTTAYMFFASGGMNFTQASNETEIDIQPPGLAIQDLGANDVIRFVINALFFIAILAALVFLIWGGVKWIISGGDKEKVSAARSTIIAAIIGLILVLLSYVILNFVLEFFGLGSINTLNLPTLKDNDQELETTFLNVTNLV